MEPRFGNHVYFPREELPKRLLQMHLVEQIGVRPKGDEQVQVAVGRRLTTTDRAEHPHISHTVLARQTKDIWPSAPDDIGYPKARPRPESA